MEKSGTTELEILKTRHFLFAVMRIGGVTASVNLQIGRNSRNTKEMTCIWRRNAHLIADGFLSSFGRMSGIVVHSRSAWTFTGRGFFKSTAACRQTGTYRLVGNHRSRLYGHDDKEKCCMRPNHAARKHQYGGLSG